MPTTSGTSKKKSSKKKTAKKVAKKAAAKKKASKKTATKKAASKRATTSSIKTISPEQRHAMISEAAYYIAEQRGFEGGTDMDDWLAAEFLINSQFGE